MARGKRMRKPPSSLPIEVIQNEILVKLPTKNLLQWRCVSKLWCSIIDQPSFALNHFKNCPNSQEKSSLLVLEPPDMVKSKQICANRNGENFRKMSSVDIEVSRFEHYQAVGCINGLLCVKRYVNGKLISKILLWNPSIQKAMEIPLAPTTNSTGIKYDIDCAFGYDHVRNDYKVVASLFIGDRYHIPNFVEIFTLSTFSWRSVNIGHGPCMWVKNGPKVFLNGVIYWGGFDKLCIAPKDKFSHFVSFDVLNDEFRYIDLPNRESGNIWANERFPIIVEQSVGMMENFYYYSQIWIMEDVTKSWTVKFKINLQLLQKCIYFKMDGELLFAGKKGGVNSYNVKSKEIKVLAKSYKISPIFTGVYQESLVLLNGVPM